MEFGLILLVTICAFIFGICFLVFISVKLDKSKVKTQFPDSEYVIECSPSDWPQQFKEFRQNILGPCQTMFDYWTITNIKHAGNFHYISIGWEKGEV